MTTAFPPTRSSVTGLRRWLRHAWRMVRALRSLWRWLLVSALLAFVLAGVFRRPLGAMLLPQPKVERLLAQADAALQAGRLTAADGSGASELYQAAQALDGDRSQARDGLAATGQAALEQARTLLAQGDDDAAAQMLALARHLQMPRVQIRPIEIALEARRQQEADHRILPLLAAASQALEAGRLDDGPDSALPLYQQVLELDPNQVRALEGREDALSDLLLKARLAIDTGALAPAAGVLQRVRRFDAGHVDLPQSEAAFNAAIEAQLRLADADLRAHREEAALRRWRAVLEAVPAQARARDGLMQVAALHASEATRLAGNFHFKRAQEALARAEAIDPAAPVVEDARKALATARVAQAALQKPRPADLEERLATHLRRFEAARARQRWLMPPGDSAFDALRGAQALAPRDPRVIAAGDLLLPELRQCFDDALPRNRVRGAGECLQAWQSLAPSDPRLPPARRRLAQRWVAVGNERLGAGDVGFAREAVVQARLLEPQLPEAARLAERLRDMTPGGG